MNLLSGAKILMPSSGISQQLPSSAVSQGMRISPPAATGYFVDQKKGEVNELKQLLKDINVERDMKRKREIIKRVIAYMTLGIDVSRLFTDMIMAIETKDIVIKKMVYLYLCNYATKEPDMAVLCINSLRRDCDDEDPMVRGLALRSLCNLRLVSILEYVEAPLQKCLGDVSAYVRKTAVMGVLKLHYLSPSTVQSNGYMDRLRSMLYDKDVNVVTNAIAVLDELLLSQGGFEITPVLIAYLLNRLGDFSEWGLNVILGIISRYKAPSEDEMFGMMNLLDPVLRTANSGAVLSTVKCFINLTANHPDLQPQIFLRAKAPLMTLITGTQAEVQYAMLTHLKLIFEHPAAEGVFNDGYRHFFVRYDEPSYVKNLKVEILPLIAGDKNARDIAAELVEYVTDVDAEVSKKAISSIGCIARRVAAVAPEMTQQLVDLVDLEMTYIRAEAVKTLVLVMRTYPHVVGYVLPFVPKFWRRVSDDPEAKAAVIWMAGEYGQDIPDAPYVLESAVGSYSQETSAVKIQLLTATMKLFFKRPPEVHPFLGLLLHQALEDNGSQDVHDRALMYYRLLRCDIQATKALFLDDISSTDTDASSGLQHLSSSVSELGFAEQRNLESRNSLISEFNSLSVVFEMPSSVFVEERRQLILSSSLSDDVYNPSRPSRAVGAGYGMGDAVEGEGEGEGGGIGVLAVPIGESYSLLDWGDETSMHSRSSLPIPTPSTPTPTPLPLLSFNPTHPTTSSSSSLVLKSVKEQLSLMDANKFQSLWGSLSESLSGPYTRTELSNSPPLLSNQSNPIQSTSIAMTTSQIEVAMTHFRISVMASGAHVDSTTQNNGFKFFLYGIEQEDFLLGIEGDIFLAQLIFFPSTVEKPSSASVVIKTKSDKINSDQRWSHLQGSLNRVSRSHLVINGRMDSSETGKAAKGGGKRVFKNSLHEKLLAWKNGTDISAVGEVAGIPETAWCGGGDIVSFPSSLSPAERRIAHQLCLRLDLFHASSGDGENRFVTVSKSGDFESIQQSATADHQATNYCIWYDERAAKPLVKSRYFLMDETEIQGLQRTLATTPGSVNGRVTVTLSSEFLLNFEIKNLSHMSHMNAKWPEGGKNRSDAECEQDMDKPHVIVDTVEELRQTAVALNACAEMAFDLEMHSYRTYHGLTCLIQLSGGGVNYIVDPLAPFMWEAVSTMLGPIFANPNIVKIGHGIMGGDIPALFRDFGIIVLNAFDTQEASGFLGRTGVGLAALLDLWGCPLRREVATLKDQMKHADWRLRPMTDVMLRYATLDVHYLVSLYKLQVRELLLSAAACVGKIGRAQQGHSGIAVQKNGGKKQLNGNVVKSKEASSTSSESNGLKGPGGDSDRLGSSGEKDAQRQGQEGRGGEGEGDEECLGGTTVTDDSLAVHLQLDNGNASGLVEDMEDEGMEVWGLDPAPDAGSNYKSKSHHLSDRFDDEGEGGEDEECEEGAGEVPAVSFQDEDALMGMDGGDDDDDMWDGWGEEAVTHTGAETGTGMGIQSADDDLAAELEVCFKQISSASPKAAKPKGKGKVKDKDKEEKEKEKEGDEQSQVVVKSNNKKSSKNDTAVGGKEVRPGSGAGGKPLSSRAQQQQKRREIKALRHEREQAKQRALLESRLAISAPAAVADLEDGEIDEGEGEAAVEEATEEQCSAEEVNEERCSAEEGESDVNDVEGDGEGEIDMEEETALPVYDDAVMLERRLRGEGVLKAIVMQYKTSPPLLATSVSTAVGVIVAGNTASTTADIDKRKSSEKEGDSKNGSCSKSDEGAVLFRAEDLGSDPRLAELQGALAASQQCCVKLWVPKKSSENAYAKVSGFSQRKKTRTASGQWEAKNVFVFRRLFLWREKEADRRDESPSYICRGSLLLDAAEFLPTSISSLMKLQSPLPASMRIETSEGVKVEPEVDIVAAVQEALEVWEGVVRKQALSSDREDEHSPFDKEKYVKQVHNSNIGKLLDKKATQSPAGKEKIEGEITNGHHANDVKAPVAAAVAAPVAVTAVDAAPVAVGAPVGAAVTSYDSSVVVPVVVEPISRGVVKVKVDVEKEVEDIQIPVIEKNKESKLPPIPSSLSATSNPTSTSTLASPKVAGAVLGIAAVLSVTAIVILRYRAK